MSEDAVTQPTRPPIDPPQRREDLSGFVRTLWLGHRESAQSIAHWTWDAAFEAGQVEERRCFAPLLADLRAALANGELVAHTDATIRGHLAALGEDEPPTHEPIRDGRCSCGLTWPCPFGEVPDASK